MKKTQENYKQYALQLIDLLNKWDFLGVANMGVQDEYTDLVGPILSKLFEGINQKDLADFVWQIINKDYGLTNMPNGLSEFTFEVIDWWQS